MVFAKKVTSNGGFSVFFLDICHANDKLPTFKINFKDEKKLNNFRCTRSFRPHGLRTRKEICPVQCSILQYGEFV